MSVHIAPETVRSHCAQYFGFEVDRVKSLGSCQDINFRVDLVNNGPSYVIKYANPETKLEELDFQVKVLNFLHSNSEGRTELHFPRPTPLLHPDHIITDEEVKVHPATPFIIQVQIPGENDGKVYKYYLYALTFIHGALLSDFKTYLSHDTLMHFGREIARFNLILKDFPTDDIVTRECEWDPKLVYTMCQQRIHVLKDECQRHSIMTYLEEMQSLVAPAVQAGKLREQLVHCDLAHYNVVAKRGENGRPYVEGIIDFGDVAPTWLVGDLAIAITPLLIHNDREVLDYVMSIVQGYHAITPLTEEEIQALWPLIVMRGILLYVSISYLLQENPENTYLQDEVTLNLEVMNKLMAINPNLAEAAIRRATGNHQVPLEPEHSLFFTAKSPTGYTDCTPLQNKIVDISVFSSVYSGGNWMTNHQGKGLQRGGSKKIANKVLHDALSKEIEDSRFSSAATPTCYVVPPFQAWFVRANVRSLEAPKSVPTFALSFVPTGAQIIAPFDAIVRSLSVQDFVQHWKRVDLPDAVFGSGEEGEDEVNMIEVRAISPEDDRVIVIAGNFAMTTTSNTVTKGQPIAAVGIEGGNNTPLHAVFTQGYRRQLNKIAHPRMLVPPLFTTGRDWHLWSYFVFDATKSLPSSRDNESTVLAQRHHYVAACQEHYFGNSTSLPNGPPQIERGYRQYMYDIYGRGYLDTVNNVAVIGHSHPKVAKVTYDQLLVLNTNSRFIYNSLGKYAEDIINLIPLHLKQSGKLNRVIFVNSGSEATDLALRIARTVVSERRMQQSTPSTTPTTTPSVTPSTTPSATPSTTTPSHYGVYRDVICVQGGYHGITTASDEVSTTLNDNPRSLETRAPWIHLVPMPNPYRGIHLQHGLTNSSSDDEISSFYADYVKRKVEELSSEGRPPSAFIAEPLEGNAGGVILPPGYLKKVYEHIRSVGGLCICDEVQIGYGRLGNVFWGFEEHDIEPDIITMAKASGNGHPLGFVITSDKIIEEFGQAQGSFFSSAGGGPVGCIIGSTILQILNDEKLQQNAFIVGEYMTEKLHEVKERHPDIIGYIHGHGLYQGIELVRNYRNKDKKLPLHGPPEPATKEAYAICERMLELGAMCHNTGDYSNVLKMKPPLCITKEDADFFAEALDIACSGW